MPLRAEAAAPDSAPKVLRTPWRIVPSRGQDLAPACLLTGAAAVAVILGFAMVAGATSYGAGVTTILLLGGSWGGLYGFMWLRRELRYFNPNAAYWMEIAADHFALITPDVSDHCPWSEIRTFDVEEVARRNRYGGRIGTSYKAVARYRRFDLDIPLGDFAGKLGQDDRDRAYALCAALNQVRERALAAQGAEFDFLPPPGLAVAGPPRKPARSVPSVVRR